MSLAELLIASSIMALLAGALSALALTVQAGSQYIDQQGTVTQHGRVVLQRLQSTLNGATANEQFPGFVAFSETIGLYSFPDTLVIWQPNTPPANPQALPLVREIVVVCPDPDAPNRLLEITQPDDAGPVPPLSDIAGWSLLLEGLKTDPLAERVELTDLLRVANAATLEAASPRGCVRFDVRLRPSESQWNDFRSGNLSWQELAWVQDLYGTGTGLRQSWCNIELQLVGPAQNQGGLGAIVFFGSAALYYEMHR